MSLSRGIERVTFLRLCSRAPRMVIWSMGIRTFDYSLFRVIANVPLAVATRRPPGASTRHSVTAVRRPAWTTRPVARSFSPTFPAEMKLSFRSKLIARTMPGLRVYRLRPMAESASAVIMPPWTNPAWLAMSSAGVISTVALPAQSSTRLIPSHRHAGDTTSTWLLTALALRHRHAGRRRTGDQAVVLVEDVGFTEEQGLPHIDHPADGAQPALDRRPEEVDLELDGGVPDSVRLEGRERHSHRGVGDLRDHASLDDAPAVAVLRSGDQLQYDPAGLGLGDPCAQGLHPPGRRGLEKSSRAPGVGDSDQPLRRLRRHLPMNGEAPFLNVFVFS